MIGLLLGAWLFWMTSFCVLGLGCRLACGRRRRSGRSCICGRHPSAAPVSGRGVPAGELPVPARPSRMRAAEARVRELQQRYVEGLLSIEQYELELDRVVGLA